MKEEIHIWNFPVKKIYVFISSEYRINLINESLSEAKLFSSKGDKYTKLASWINKQGKKYGLVRKFNSSDIYLWMKGERIDYRTNKIHPKYMPLWVVLELAKLAREPLIKIKNNVNSYRAGGSGKIITNPKLPIIVSPELDSIIINLICDGSFSNVPSYFNTDEILRDNFIQKVKNCFGDFEFKTYENGCQIRIPSAIALIIKQYFKVSRVSERYNFIEQQ